MVGPFAVNGGVVATNRLLECLTRKDRAHLLDRCELVELTFPDVLAEPGDTMLHV